ncbi:hypothetical protein Ahy_A04g020851 [Arachis hypogaea]|uniref:Auxin-induced protein n=1 Tax=Arachis hypogaea TaxID=3818 RepID=A0A445DIN6_ARAHY|nr:hypothetical protein Ahy_A04g020851 [Arachis hypogaea]
MKHTTMVAFLKENLSLHHCCPSIFALLLGLRHVLQDFPFTPKFTASRRVASFSAKQAISKSVQVPKGYLAVYVVDNQKRYLHSKSSSEVEEEFGYDHLMGGGYDHPIGGLTIPCSEHVFHQLASPLS